MLNRGIVVSLAALAALSAPLAHAASCMVLGDKTAVVQAREGRKSPAFLTESCEDLRLVSGKAMVSWVGRDGKPNFVPVGPQGVEKLPAPGTEERSARVVFSELGSKRDAQRAGFMRSVNAFDGPRPSPVFVPADGLVVGGKPEALVQVKVVEKEAQKLVHAQRLSADGSLRLDRQLLQPGALYLIEWPQAEKTAALRIRTVSEADQRALDERIAQIQGEVADEEQRAMVLGMLFEQLRLPFNMHLALSKGQGALMAPATTAAP